MDEKDEKYEFAPYKTDLKKAGCHYFCCCCADSDEYYQVDLCYKGTKTRTEVVQQLLDENDACTCLLRLCGFLLHFYAYYGMLYPLIMLVGMIPFIGAVGATVLIFIAFFIACISFLFLIACAWICARPWLAILIFMIIAAMVISGKQVRDKLVADGVITTGPSSKRLYAGRFFGVTETTQQLSQPLSDHTVSQKFLYSSAVF